MSKKIFISLLLTTNFIFAEEGFDPITTDSEPIIEVMESKKEAESEIVLNDFDPPPPVQPTLKNETFPLNTTFGYSLEKNNGEYFVETQGEDILNKSLDRKLNFLIRLPVYQPDKSNKFNGYPDKFYLNFLDPFFKFTIGDGKYTLSDLLMKNNKARGTSLSINPSEYIGLKTQYTLSTKDFPRNDFGFSILLNPISFLNLNANFLYSDFLNKNYKNLPNKNLTYSFKTGLDFEDTKLALEAAATNNISFENSGFFATFKTKFKKLSYNSNFILANRNFVGHYNNLKESKNNLQFDFTEFALTLEQDRKKNNIDRNTFEEKAERIVKNSAIIKYPALKDIDMFLTFRNLNSKNVLNLDGFYANTIKLSSKSKFTNYSFENGLEFGKYHSKIEDYKSRNIKSLEVIFNYDIEKDSVFSLYTKLGNILLENIYINSYAFGSNFSTKIKDRLDFIIAYEYSLHHRKSDRELPAKTLLNWDNHYFKEDLKYTFDNDHSIILSSRINKPLSDKKEKEFLLTYTIPFEVVSINRGLARIRNTIVNTLN
ncbi:MAG: hypothetical protein A3F40_02680 [Chlamydiae bacterium RIFCSPHIGHO2_12_FULL_27_8]|nr:MAG: hypothetical protein A3F40_02680 [Chlamydiae bacterium RIFCSPHIGHO2_12_FULL_27_8]OGN66302.1 MAG: hypothetical protein A2888_00450 [Chlamydiae bacterium RIFCSPLOWO2_01_FULL_28_7]